MFNKVLVKLTGIFLFCISATSATPSGQPGEAQNINDDIRARAPYPTQPYHCDDPFIWVRRECVGSTSPQAWQDVCRWNSFVTIYDYKPGQCPFGYICIDILGMNGVRTINCILDTGEASTGKRKADPQWGTSSTKSGRTQVGNTQQQYSVTIDHDMTGASVAAVFESNDGSFLIAPNNVIVGNVHGYKENVCKGDKSSPIKARECYPNGNYDFKSGQTIDFTWGMTGDQEGKLVYAVVPVA